MRLSQEEFNRRCHEVFVSNEGDAYYTIDVDGDETVIQMAEEPDLCATFDYMPNMIDRPHALGYLLGERDDFDD